MAVGPTFVYNSPRILGQTVFIKRGPHQGKLGMVRKQVDDDHFTVTHGDFGDQHITFERGEFLVYRHRKMRIPIDRVIGKSPNVI
ncbi:DUF3912 family protein [Idiomarina xiamenensis]|uniref:KOW domain-containing protein n=1 Tax=Idiomarina xiamenensis 10-D-4 TaxID=740709 RepID=K2KWP0_9GAMM|nr:DUF3912 family protein [Idiomarina xiamenensis]EKE86909.1 hypothetical protein A10D4_01667 [Idiomarina xiamenensis 10-D-4]